MTKKKPEAELEAPEAEVEAPAKTAEQPRKGGSYTRQPDGALTRTEHTKPAKGRVNEKEA